MLEVTLFNSMTKPIDIDITVIAHVGHSPKQTNKQTNEQATTTKTQLTYVVRSNISVVVLKPCKSEQFPVEYYEDFCVFETFIQLL